MQSANPGGGSAVLTKSRGKRSGFLLMGAATLLGVVIDSSGFDPIQALF